MIVLYAHIHEQVFLDMYFSSSSSYLSEINR